METLNILVDPYLIQLFRITGYTFADFLMGTFLLAFTAVVIGEVCIGAVFLMNRQHIAATTDDVVRYQKVSDDALAVGDKEAYAASNKMANDAFGKSFFSQIAMSAASLWPVFFIGGWMQYRFADVEFQMLFTDFTVGVLCPLVALYIAARLVFKRIKYRLPFFREIKKILDSQGRPDHR
ncbi:MAG: hypothetical protein AB1646_12720 [Thermodesulfobacteriota bacterium]